jgi:hypothetical protein
MAPDDRFAEMWNDIPDPIASGEPEVSSDRPMRAPVAPSPTRGATKLRRMVALAAFVAWPLLLRLVWGLRPDIEERLSFVLGQTALFGLLLVAVLLVAVLPGRRGLGRPVSLVRLAAIGAPIVFAVVGLLWLPSGAPGSFGEVGPWGPVMKCLSLGLLVALPMLMVGLWAMRRAFPSASGWRAAALGAGLGLVGSVVLTAHCGIQLGGHVALAHGLPIVIAALLGAALGSKVARA